MALVIPLGIFFSMTFGEAVTAVAVASAGATVVYLASEHQKNKRPSNWDKHSKRRSSNYIFFREM